MGALWHGFADMGAVERDGELVIARGEGAYIWDSEGTRYLDAAAGLWFTNVGHGRVEIADAVADQIRRVAAYSTFGDFAVDVTVRLAERLAAIAPVPDTAGLTKRLRSHGIATRAVGGGGIQCSPPLVMTDDEVTTVARAIGAPLEENG